MATTISAVLQLSKLTKRGKCPISIRATVDRKNTYRSTGFKILPEHWDETRKRVSKDVPNHHLINTTIARMINDLQRDLLELELTGSVITRDTAKRSLNEEDEDFINYATRYLAEMEGVKKLSTLRENHSNLSKIKEYTSLVFFSEMDAKWLEQFSAWMAKRGDKENTRWKTLKFIRTVFNRALNVDKVTKFYPFKEFKLKYTDPLKEWLEMDELETLWDLAYSENLSQAQTVLLKYFLLGCYSGLRYSDLVRVADGQVIRRGKIYMKDHKTGGLVSVPLQKKALQLSQELHGKRLMSNQNGNAFLKDIFKGAKINKPVSFHMARHTFAVLGGDLGIDMEVMQRLLGHADIKSTAIYYKITDKAVKQAMEKWEG